MRQNPLNHIWNGRYEPILWIVKLEHFILAQFRIGGFSQFFKKDGSSFLSMPGIGSGKHQAQYSFHSDVKLCVSSRPDIPVTSKLYLLLLREPFLFISLAVWKFKVKAHAPRLGRVGDEVTVEEGASQQTVFLCISFLLKSYIFMLIWFKPDLTSDLWGA